MKKWWVSLAVVAIVAILAACGGAKEESTDNATEETNEKKSLTVVWLPNESGEDLKSARDEFGTIIKNATGLEVEHQITTDYIIAIESVANGNADMAFLGPQGYVEAHAKNDKVLPLVVPSGKSGTVEDAVYYSWLAVNKADATNYKSGDQYSIDNIAGKRFSFVSSSSTSGFKVPAANIIKHFADKNLTQEDLLEGGSDKFFSEVLFGNTHQGAAVNLLSGKADVAAFCDTCVANYVELTAGELNKAGSEMKVKSDAAEPFNTVPGKEYVIISSTPVLNSPFVINSETLTQEMRDQLLAAFTSDEVANNQKIFVPEDSEFSGIFAKKGDERFVQVDDAWFNPIRELSK
jgi:phosphonate transport system substrate-binding protein